MSNGTKKARRYSTPKLTRYGDMVKLTAAGSLGEPEAGTSASNKILP